MVVGEGGGGIERSVYALSSGLAFRGHDVTVYARKRYCSDCAPFINGVRVRYLPTIYRKNIEAILHTFFCVFDVLFRKVDVIHFHGVGPSLLSFIPRLLRPRVTIITTFHAQDKFHQKWSWFGRVMLGLGEWTTCKIPCATITVSHALQVYCRDKYDTEAVYIPNGVEAKVNRRTSELGQFGLKRGEYILTVGRILKVKGIHHLIKAFRRVKTSKKLVIVGPPVVNDGYFDELKRLARGDSRIVFLGFQGGEILDQLYSHAYLYCQPSESEGLPLTVLEAMSHGTAVLVSDIPGNIEAIHRSGFTFETRDVDDLAVQLQHLVLFPDQVRRAARDVRNVIREFFNMDTVVDETLDVYLSCRH